jgi:hypothetical protein
MSDPSCLISCGHSSPEGGRGAFVGRHGWTKPAGRVRGRDNKALYLAGQGGEFESWLDLNQHHQPPVQPQQHGRVCVIRDGG